MTNAFYALVAIAMALTSPTSSSAATQPVIITTNVFSTEPAATGQVAGTVTTQNPATSWAITNCSGCANYFAINNGIITLTSAGAAAITTPRNYNIFITAANSGASSAGMITATFTNTAAACPRGVSATDGCLRAPVGSPQRPAILNGYKQRPPWNVAGVDYYVGAPVGSTLVDWQTLGTTAGIDISGHTIRCDGTYAASPTSNTVTLDGVDFSLHGGATIYMPSGGCSGLFVTNSNFGSSGCANGSSSSYYLVQNQNAGAPIKFKYNTVNMMNCEMGVAAVLDASGDVVLEYNYFYGLQGQILQAAPGPYNVKYRFNLVDTSYYQFLPTNHMNLQEFGTGVSTVSDLVAYNTVYQPYNAPNMGNGEIFQFYGNAGGVQTGAALMNNTMIALDTGSCKAAQTGCLVSYAIHGTGKYSPTTTVNGPAYNQNNYFDTSGMFGAYYTGSTTAALGWTSSGNIDMKTGAIITPQ